MKKALAAALAVAAFALTAPVFAQSQLPSFAPVIKKAAPAVVNIGVKGTVAAPRNPFFDDPGFRRFFGLPPDSQPREREFRSAGSGVIVDAANGYIVTNAHVVQNASEITITLMDDVELKAEVVDEGAVDLDLVEREALQIAQRGIAGAEIVKRDPHPQAAELMQHRQRDLVVANEHRLGDLELEPAGRDARCCQCRGDVEGKRLAFELHR